MKRMWLALLPLLTLVACRDKHDEPEPRWRRVVVVCLWGENSLSNCLQRDLNEMRQGCQAIPEGCKLVVYLDNSRTNDLPHLLSYDAREGQQTVLDYRSDPVSTDSAAMQQLLATVMKRFPADHYGLVIGSHGSGWVPVEPPRRTIGVDNGRNTYSNVGTEMEIPTLAHILRRTGRRWDYVVFDACFMQTVEVAYELRDAVGWCIASPAEIPAEGAPYDRLMGSLFAEEDEQWRIAEDYFEAYRDEGGLVISAVRTDRLAELALATRPLIARLPQYPPTDGIQRYYGTEYDGQWLPEFFDMGSAIHRWCSEADYLAWRSVLREAVPHRFATAAWTTSYDFVDARIADPDVVGTLSMFIPTENGPLNTPFRHCQWYDVSGWK